MLLFLRCAGAASADTAAKLEGHWVLNAAASDDAEAMLQERVEQRRREMERMMRYEERMSDLPPLMGDESARPSEQARERARKRRWQQMERYRQMLAISPTLTIRRIDDRLEFASEVETRRFEPGSRSQVSMPEGQIADSRVEWDGDWLVVTRRARGGPRVTEKFRLTRSGQLEYFMAWGGETDLAGLKIRRFYDRSEKPFAPRIPDLGPLR